MRSFNPGLSARGSVAQQHAGHIVRIDAVIADPGVVVIFQDGRRNCSPRPSAKSPGRCGRNPRSCPDQGPRASWGQHFHDLMPVRGIAKLGEFLTELLHDRGALRATTNDPFFSRPAMFRYSPFSPSGISLRLRPVHVGEHFIIAAGWSLQCEKALLP